MKNYSTEIAQAIKDHLCACETKLVAFNQENGSFGFSMHLDSQISFIHYVIKVFESSYIVVAICPVSPAAGNSAVLAAMAEFICRANYGLKNGNFEMDFRDGQLRYKCFVDCGEQIPSQSVVRSSIGVPAAMMERYAAGIIGILYKGMDAESAVKECEQTRPGDLEAARRALVSLLQKRLAAGDSEPAQDDEAAADGEEEVLPSFEEFLRMMASSESGDEAEEIPEDPTDDDETVSVP